MRQYRLATAAAFCIAIGLTGCGGDRPSAPRSSQAWKKSKGTVEGDGFYSRAKTHPNEDRRFIILKAVRARLPDSANWQPLDTTGDFLVAEFTIPSADTDRYAPARLQVYVTDPVDITTMLKTWAMQFAQADESLQQTLQESDAISARSHIVQWIEFSGKLTTVARDEEMAGWEEKDWVTSEWMNLVGVATRHGQTTIVRVIGPRQTINAAKPQIKNFVESIQSL